MRVVMLSTALSIVALPGTAFAQADVSCGQCGTPQRTSAMPPAIALNLYKGQMVALREEALEQRRQDGGQLSDESRAAIQRRIDHIERTYRRRVRDFNPYVDSAR